MSKTCSIKFNPSQPEASLLALARFCDQSAITPEQIPSDFVNYYGIEILSNSLKLKFPDLPDFDLADATAHMTGRKFGSLETLVQTIASRPSEIDKLFCTFHYMAHNVRYSHNSKSQKPADVFMAGIAICEGYAALTEYLAEHSGIKSFEIHHYSSVAKGVGWNPLSPPSPLKSNHASVVLVIDGYPWLCEPTWGAGFQDGSGVTHQQFNSGWFLRPLICTLNDHFPVDGVEQYLGEPFPYDRFLRCPKYQVNEHEFRNESHPFQRFDVEGSLRVTFGINHTATKMKGRFYKLEEKEQVQMDDDFQAVELAEPGETRSRFFLHFVFPTVGLYRVCLAVNTWVQTEMLVENRKPNSDVPFLSYAEDDEKFIPIQPLRGVSVSNSGLGLIRFQVSKHRSELLVMLISPQKQESRTLSQYVRLVIPDDDTRYEEVIVASFPEVGRWIVKVYLNDDFGKFTRFVNYRFDVTRASRDIVSPLACIPNDRVLIPLEVPDDFSITPSGEAVISDSLTFEVEVRFVRDLVFNLKPLEGAGTIFPKELEVGENGKQKTGRYRFTVPEAGIYKLVIWLDDESIVQKYAVGIPRLDLEWAGPVEEAPVANLEKISQPPVGVPTSGQAEAVVQVTPTQSPILSGRAEASQNAKPQGDTGISADAETKKSSKCCLLL
jgi:hypothetical protein